MVLSGLSAILQDGVSVLVGEPRLKGFPGFPLAQKIANL
jgi:hypothetical protein